MSATNQKGWIESSVNGQSAGEEINFRRSTEPGALVEVTIGEEHVNVSARTLLAAVQLMQIEED